MPVRATLEHGQDFKPTRVRRGRLLWLVQEVAGQWTHPASAPETIGRPECLARWVLRVWGPLPGHPRDRGEFTMIARRYGDRPGWFIEPAGWEPVTPPA